MLQDSVWDRRTLMCEQDSELALWLCGCQACVVLLQTFHGTLHVCLPIEMHVVFAALTSITCLASRGVISTAFLKASSAAAMFPACSRACARSLASARPLQVNKSYSER